MKLLSIHIAIFFSSLLMFPVSLRGQDPSFSQFFAVPATLNPATTGAYDEDLRVLANLRQQWLDPAAPYYTGSITFDAKLFRTRTSNPDYKNDNILALRVGFLHDNTFNGILKGSYAHAQVAYHQVLDEDGENRIGAGFGASFGRQFLDQSRLLFASQFTSGGFNGAISSGETLLSSMKNSLSLSTGLHYTFSNDDQNSTVEFGVAAFHLNQPRQSFLKDSQQVIPRRLTSHLSFDFVSGSYNSINLLSAYQQQASNNTLLAGIGYNKNLTASADRFQATYLSVGALYRLQDAIIPYISIYTRGMRIGLSYDATISKLLLTPGKPKTFELSFRWQMERDELNSKCPRVFSSMR
ncbi:MAG: type IX secretion system membrane protein PorP/SprF [Bacteroidetes bacterium]|nr:type IX secretion system membrane protein PorP/SprF [Bacteroidota bacterium]